MFVKYKFNKPTIASVLDTRRIKKNGVYPVKIRLTYERKFKYFKTPYDLSIAEWKKIEGSKTRTDYLKDTKEGIKEFLDKAEIIIKQIGYQKFSFKAFEDKFLIDRSESNNVYASFNDYISVLESEGRIGTRDTYYNAMRSLSKYQESLRCNSLTFTEINVEFLKNYNAWMLENGTVVQL